LEPRIQGVKSRDPRVDAINDFCSSATAELGWENLLVNPKFGRTGIAEREAQSDNFFSSDSPNPPPDNLPEIEVSPARPL
jgi:hypothetical protein